MQDNCRRIDDIREEVLVVITILRGIGTKDDMCRRVKQYYQKQENGCYQLLFEDDPCK